MLLYSHGVRSRFSTALVFASYLLNTVTFFRLIRNLSSSKNDRSFLDKAINSLFSAEACGGSSAISLCYQLTGTDPVGSLSGFYDNHSFANMNTVTFPWIWTTLVLPVLVTRQLGLFRQQRKHSVSELPPSKHNGIRRSKQSCGSHASFINPFFSFAVLSLATVAFFLCLVYQYLLVGMVGPLGKSWPCCSGCPGF